MWTHISGIVHAGPEWILSRVSGNRTWTEIALELNERALDVRVEHACSYRV